jgi:hypothetical protein
MPRPKLMRQLLYPTAYACLGSLAAETLLKGLSHQMEWILLLLIEIRKNKQRGWFWNFLNAPMI